MTLFINRRTSVVRTIRVERNLRVYLMFGRFFYSPVRRSGVQIYPLRRLAVRFRRRPGRAVNHEVLQAGISTGIASHRLNKLLLNNIR